MSSKSSSAREKLSFEIELVHGLVDSTTSSNQDGTVTITSVTNKHKDTIVDVIAYNDMSLQTIHEAILPLLSLQFKDKTLYYYLEHEKSRQIEEAEEPSDTPLNMESTLAELEIESGDRLLVDSQKRNKRRRMTDTEFGDRDDDEVQKENDDDTLEFVCITRIFENEGLPLRRTRVYVKKYHPCSYLMEDICVLWNRQNLKFRCGRIVLVPEKTYDELGISSLSNEEGDEVEITVTGGRG
jgi:hypothetical protein